MKKKKWRNEEMKIRKWRRRRRENDIGNEMWNEMKVVIFNNGSNENSSNVWTYVKSNLSLYVIMIVCVK